MRLRYHYIDWLRILVISLVVAHHAGHAYATIGGAWPVHDPERTALLTPFFAVNAAFGMGFLFFIAGIFVPGSLAFKGVTGFIKARVVRLGIPLLVFGFGVFAVSGYWDSGGGTSFRGYYLDTYIGEWKVEFGHLWFAFHLLLYSVVYAGLAALIPALTTRRSGRPAGHAPIIGLVVVLAAAGGLARLASPQDVWFKVLWTVPIEPAHLPQYVLMFAAGTIAGRYGWLKSFPSSVGNTWLRIGLFAVALCYGLVYLDSYGGFTIIESGVLTELYPVWEAVLCVGLCVGITTFARDRWDRPVAWLPALAGATYGVYLVHIFVVIAFNAAFLDLALPGFAKFLLVTVLTLATTFPAILLFRKIPLVSRVV